MGLWKSRKKKAEEEIRDTEVTAKPAEAEAELLETDKLDVENLNEQVIVYEDEGIPFFTRRFYTQKGGVDCVYSEYSEEEGIRMEFLGGPKNRKIRCNKGFYGDSELVEKFEKMVQKVWESEEERAKLTDMRLQKLIREEVPEESYKELKGRIFAYHIREDGRADAFYISNIIVKVEPPFEDA